MCTRLDTVPHLGGRVGSYANLPTLTERSFTTKDDEWQCPPGQEFAAQFGLGYRIRSSCETDWILVRNLHFLQDYLVDDEPPVSPQVREIIELLFPEKAGYSRFELLHAHPRLPFDVIYHRIADETLYIDLTAAPLRVQTHPEQLPC